MMKFFAFIMAFVVLGLSIFPCVDDELNIKASKIKTEITKQHNEQKDQEHNDACSPFCQCACCAGLSINNFFAGASSPALIDCKLYTSYLPESIIKISSSIWRPPQS
ncbi:MAG: DUF6660 family protein [Chitinophagaceae bacterium]